MTFWILAGVIAAFCVVVLGWPLLRRGRAGAQSAAAYDVEIYAAQLKEIERDLARGILSQAEVAAARAEIGRRLLAADSQRSREEAETRPAAPRGGSFARLAGIGGAMLLPVLGVVLYLELGAPTLPAQPFAARGDERAAQAREGEQIVALRRDVQRMEEAVAANPQDLQGWLSLGGSYMVLEEYGQAANAFRRALVLSPSDPEIMASEAEAMIAGSDGAVGEQARFLLEAALERDPSSLRARFYLADSEWQMGRRQRALEAWAALRADGPADAPWQPVVEGRILRASAELGLDPQAYLPAPQPPTAPMPPIAGLTQPAPGPSADDVAAAADMSEQDRQEMIRGMVGGLAARLAEEPNDLQGWLRLIRSYRVLGDTAAADGALEQARAAFADDPRALATLDRGGAAPDAPPALPDLSPDAEAIAGMVEGLATRLADNPDDIEGWVRLIQSYSVLGRQDDALVALRDGFNQFQDQPEQAMRLVALARELNLLPQADTLPVGPSMTELEGVRALPLAQRRERLSDSVGVLDRWLADNPDSLPGWVRLAHAFRVLEQPAEERDALKRATALAPENAALWRALGRAAFEADGRQIGPDALAAMQRLLELSPEDVEANWMLALSRLAAGDLIGARGYFDRALAGLPEGSSERDELGRQVETLMQGG